jgi:hypothetical protein
MRLIIVFALLSLLITLCPQGPVSALGYSVHASVSSFRAIVVDKYDHIIEITSNTSLDVPPHVYRYKMGGKLVPLDSSIESQYLSLTKHSDFSKPRIIYGQNVKRNRKTVERLPLQKSIINS